MVYGEDIHTTYSVQQFPEGRRVTVKYFRGNNLILQKRILQKQPKALISWIYDFMYEGELYTQYFYGPHKRSKSTYNQKRDHIKFLLSKHDEKDNSIIADCIVPSLKKDLEHKPTHFEWIDSKGNGCDDRFYFSNYNEKDGKWKLLEAFRIDTVGTVYPVDNNTLKQWAIEFEAIANQ